MDSEPRGGAQGRLPYPILPASGPAQGSAACLNVRTSCKSTSKHASVRQIRLRWFSAHRPAPGKRKGEYIVALGRKRWQVKTFVECYPRTGERTHGCTTENLCENPLKSRRRLAYRPRAGFRPNPEKTTVGQTCRFRRELPQAQILPLGWRLLPARFRRRA